VGAISFVGLIGMGVALFFFISAALAFLLPERWIRPFIDATQKYYTKP